MYRFAIAAAAAALAVPAAAQPQPYDDPLADEIVRAIPPAEQIEAMAPALDRMIGALMNVEVGPLIDAADPHRRDPEHGRPGRTLGELGRRDDPHFEDRVRSSLYGATGAMGRMTGALAAAAPAFAQALRQMERAMTDAAGEYRGAEPRWED